MSCFCWKGRGLSIQKVGYHLSSVNTESVILLYSERTGAEQTQHSNFFLLLPLSFPSLGTEGPGSPAGITEGTLQI